MKPYQEVLYSLFLVPFTAGNGVRNSDGLRIHDGSISTSAIAIFLVGIAFVSISVSSSPIHQDPENAIRYILMTIVLIGIGAILTLWVKFLRQMRENEVTVNYATNSKPTGLRLKFLWLFCVGLIVRAALSIAGRVHNISISHHLARSYVSILWNLLLFIFSCLQTAFISYFRNTEIIGSIFVHYGMIFIVVANISIWFDSILAQEKHVFHSSNETTQVNGVESYNCTNIASVVCLAESAFPYVYPIVAEFCLVSTGFLFRIWSTAKKTSIKKFLMTPTCPNEESLPLVNSEYVEIGKPTSFQDESRRKSALLYLSAAIGVVLVIVLIIFVTAILTEKGEDKLIGLYKSLEIYRLLYTVIMLGLVFLGFGLLYGQCVPVEIHRQLTTGEYILLFSFLGMVMYLMYGVVAGINYSGLFISSWSIAENILLLVVVYFQTVFILQSYRYRRYRRLDCLSIKNVFMLLSVMNLGLWFNDSFLQNRVPYINAVNYKMYTQQTWDFMNGTLFPIVVFFRFHSSMILYELHHMYRSCN
uniref:Uncharacterized protein LOC111133628 n=1 Tax=Crassostrea virginica TaxID=6565 RepID=A0A8B8EEB1_CRAVI|nr:uncharacterized protein LOC111133628 [Crassostrea virginica]